MAYRRTNWRESETALSADNMNNIEDGIQEALAKASSIENNTYRRSETYSKAEIYAKAETYTKAEVNTLVDEKIGGKIVVSSVPPTDSQGSNGDIWLVVV